MDKTKERLTPKSTRKKARKIIAALKKLFPNAKIVLNFSNPWQLYVAVVLSAQTTDKKVNQITEALFKKYKTISDYKNASQKNLEKDIRSIGLFRNKAKHIRAAAKLVIEKYHGKIPNSMEELLEIPGVGRKTANVILGNLYGIVEGIAVDTHVFRLSRLFGLSDGKNAEKVEKDLMLILPKNEWFKFTYRMIEYGRKYCKANCKHNSCPLKLYA